MATTDYRLAAPQPVLLQFEDEAGQPITDMAFQLRIGLGSACVTVPGVLSGTMFEFNLSELTLTQRLYPATVYSDDGTGWAFNRTIYINVIGGC